MIVQCSTCLKEFNKRPAKVKRSKKHYCSTDCKHLGDRNRVVVRCKTCNKYITKKAGRVSKDNYCDNTCKFLGQQGEHAANWRGGLSTERYTPAYKKWRLNVFVRDSFTCQKCHTKGSELNAHHIYPYSTNPEARLQEANGDTLCKRCHVEFHQTYSYSKATAEDYWRWIDGE